MCGLFGVIPTASNYTRKLRQLFRELAKANDKRGGHSWGLWGKDQPAVRGLGQVSKEGDYVLTRVAKYWPVLPGQWLAGHTRYGTHGSITVENAHPYDFDRFMLAHNGVVHVDGFYAKDHPVDSGRIGLSIKKHGFKDGMLKVHGSCGLILSKDGLLWIYRHHQVLHVANGPWGWAFSSTRWHLMDALREAGLVYHCIKEVEEDVFTSPWTEGAENFAAPAGEILEPIIKYSWKGYKQTDHKFDQAAWIRDTFPNLAPYLDEQADIDDEPITTPFAEDVCENCLIEDKEDVIAHIIDGVPVYLCSACYHDAFTEILR